MGNTIRDVYAMERFSMTIESFDENVKMICDTMESAIYAAENGMRDEATKQAADILYELINSVKSITNPLDEEASALTKGAKVLRRLDDINFRR